MVGLLPPNFRDSNVHTHDFFPARTQLSWWLFVATFVVVRLTYVHFLVNYLMFSLLLFALVCGGQKLVFGGCEQVF